MRGVGGYINLGGSGWVLMLAGAYYVGTLMEPLFFFFLSLVAVLHLAFWFGVWVGFYSFSVWDDEEKRGGEVVFRIVTSSINKVKITCCFRCDGE